MDPKLCLIFTVGVCSLLAAGPGVAAQRRRISANQNGAVEFDCPDEFGYYAHPTDCTQYYVCVFGGALLESCTGGLMYSHELQTCDWPRNVGCGESGSQQGVSTVRVTDARTGSQQQGSWRSGSTPATPSTRQMQSQRAQHNPAPQYPLYADELGPAEEAEAIEGQQRVYRGQPHTVGQVARDRDGLRLQHSAVTNSIPLVSNGRTTADKSSAYVQQQYRPDPPQPTVQDYVPSPAPRAPASNYTQYDPYNYPSYDDEVEIYRDVDYSSQYPSGGQQYRGQSPYKVSPTAPAPTPAQQDSGYRGQYVQQQNAPQYTQQPQQQDAYVRQDYSNYNAQAEPELEYEPQPSPQAPSRQSSRVAATPTPTESSSSVPRATNRPHSSSTTEAAAPASRRDRQRGLFRGTPAPSANEASLSEEAVTYPSRSRNAIPSGRGSSRTRVASCVEDDAGCSDSENRVSESPPRSRARPTASSVETSSFASATRSSVAPSRSRGSATYTGGDSPASTANRGSVRSRPTLKPSTAIVSKAAAYIDVYRYPPTRPEPIYPTPRVDQSAAKCRKDVCLLPDCYCGGKEVPNGFVAEEIPQIVLLTFDDSVNDLNKGLYQSLFERGRRNPNGCPISATFYVSHEWTDYSQVQNLYADGHEMASHSISHSFGEQFSQKKWTREIAGQREILAAYGGVHLEDVRGMRAPFLAVGGNKMFKMLYDANFTYDSSMPVYENRPPSYPYTLDYKLFHDCMIPPCPTRSYPGVWEVPMVMWQDLNGGRCSMGDACSNPPTADGVYKMLIKNFERHYTTNRAPFGLYYHAAWFTQPHHKEGFEAFLDTIVAMDDVWLTTNWQAIQWMRDPQPLSTVKNFAPFSCDYPERPGRCNNPKVCNLWHKSGVRYMRTCQPCPDIYPWTGKTGVRNSRVDNNEVEES